MISFRIIFNFTKIPAPFLRSRYSNLSIRKASDIYIYLLYILFDLPFQTPFSHLSPFSIPIFPPIFRTSRVSSDRPSRNPRTARALLLLNQDRRLSFALSPAHVLFSFRVITFEGSRNTGDPSLLDAQPTRPQGIGLTVFFLLSLSLLRFEKLALLHLLLKDRIEFSRQVEKARARSAVQPFRISLDRNSRFLRRFSLFLIFTFVVIFFF